MSSCMVFKIINQISNINMKAICCKHISCSYVFGSPSSTHICAMKQSLEVVHPPYQEKEREKKLT